MAESRQGSVKRRGRRRWSFAGRVFDEANWSLIVDGQRVPVESKPLELLRELLLRAGQVVSKDELLDTIWPEVTVVEASLPTAVRKLRLALGDQTHERAMIETISGIGYRFAIPVEVEDLGPAQETLNSAPLPAQAPQAQTTPHGALSDRQRATNRATNFALLAGLTILVGAIAWGLGSAEEKPPMKAAPSFSQRDAEDALRKLDVASIEKMLAAGWNPNTPFDDQNNGAVNILLNMCEWDPGHDRRQMLLMTRTLFDGGARVADRNVWGDTPYSIAKADRYCGPDHPVTKLIRRMCYEGNNAIGDRCLADYKRDSSGAVVRRF